MKNKIIFLMGCLCILLVSFDVQVYKEVNVKNNNYLVGTSSTTSKNKRYKVKNNFIKSGYRKNTKSNLIEEFQIVDSQLKYKCDVNTEYVGTGCEVQLSNNGEVYHMVVYGDVNGDGDRTITDAVRVAMSLENSSVFSNQYYQMAADVNQDGSVSIGDAMILAQTSLNSEEISVNDDEEQDDSLKTIITFPSFSISLIKNVKTKVEVSINKKNVTIVGWKSENLKVATVDSNGYVVGVGGGSTKIVLTASDGSVASIGVTVSVPATGIVLDKSSLSLKVSEKASLKATISPIDVTDKKIIWKSSNDSVATVTDDGVVKGVSDGSVVITATTHNGLNASSKVTVSKAIVPVASVVLSKTSATLDVGANLKLTATVSPTDATDKTITWSSNNSKIATVDQTGKVMAISAGTTQIVATSKNGIKAQASITVKNVVTNVTETDFSNMENCNDNTVVMKNNGVSLHKCIDNYNTLNKNSGMQNFGITKDYVYFSFNGNRSFVKKSDYTLNQAYEMTSEVKVARISRKAKTFQVMSLKYAGHAQNFDVDSNDNLYVDAYPMIFTTTLNDAEQYGSLSKGLSVTGFYGNDTGKLRIPSYSITSTSDFNSYVRKNSSDYKVDGVIDSKKYFDGVKSISNNDTKYPYYITFAVDDVKDHIAITHKRKTVYIYSLSKFKKGGTLTPIYSKISNIPSNQGIELSGNYLYVWIGAPNAETIQIQRYNIVNGKMEKSATFSPKSYYDKKNGTGYESEGIRIYNGVIYVGVVYRKCMNADCSSKKKYNDIFSVSGI